MRLLFLALGLAAGLCAQTPVSPYPGALDSLATLGMPADNVSSALTSPMTALSVTAQVANAVNIPQWSLITFGSELAQVCLKVGNTLTFGTPTACPAIAGRGLSGTTVAAHNTGVIGYLNANAYYQQALASAMIAVEAGVPRVTSDLAFTSLTQACTAASSAAMTLAVTKPWPIPTTATLACSLSFFGGGKIAPAAGVTVTITGTVTAPAFMIFDYSAGGSIILAAHSPGVLPEWCGAIGDSSTDDSTAFANCVSAIPSGGTISLAAGKTYSLGSTGFAPRAKQMVEGNGATVAISGAAYAIRPLTVANVYATSVAVRNLTINSTSTGGCLNWAASYSQIYNVICTLQSGIGATGLLLPGDVNGTGPYYNDFYGFYQQSQTNASTQIGVNFTCSTTRCPNTNHFFGGRFGQASVGAKISGAGNSFHGVTFELDASRIGVEVTSSAVSTSLFGGYYEAGGGVTGATGIQIDSGANNTISILPLMTGLSCSGCSFASDSGTETTLIDSKGQLGASVFPNIIDAGLVSAAQTSTCSSAAGQLRACSPTVLAYTGNIMWSSGAGNTSPFFIPAYGGGLAQSSEGAAYAPPPASFTILSYHGYVAVAPTVPVTFAFYINGASQFTCVIPANANECSGTTTTLVTAPSSFISWRASWTGLTQIAVPAQVALMAYGQ